MTCHRRYYFSEDREWVAGGHPQVLAYLRHQCEAHWWFNEPSVEGAPYNRFSFSFTVSGRDQWWCHTRATRLAQDIYRYVLYKDPDSVPYPFWESLEREGGRYQVPTSPWGG